MSWRVLIVEDEALVALTLEGALAEAGYDVVCVADRSEPARICARQQALDLAVIDVRLAGGDDGITLAEELVAIQPPLRILFATGNPALVRQRARIGCVCLAKPFDVEWLLDVVRALQSGGTSRCPGYFTLESA